MLKSAGAFVSDDNLVRFPAAMVEDAIASAPSRIVLSDRNGEPALFLEGTRVHVGTGSDCLYLLDPETGEHRRFVQEDLISGYHLCDALPRIDFVMSMGIPSDVDVERSYDTQMALMLEHTTKPIVFVTDSRSTCQKAIDMAAAVTGGHDVLTEQPCILLYSEPSSPLQQSETAIDKLLLMAEYKLPVVHAPAVLMGGTGPITPAAGLAQGIAEILSSLVLHQLKTPGAPFVFGGAVHHLDMRAMQTSYASPEAQRSNVLVAQMGRWYGMPTWGFVGCSDSKVLDEQAAAEAMLTVMIAKLSGVNLAHDAGYLASGLTMSYEMVVLTDELVAMMDHLTPSVHLSKDTFLLDEIDHVGPGGNYLDSPETASRFRDFWYPDLFSRDIRGHWWSKGATTLGQRLNAKVREILQEHRPKPLNAECKSRIWEIVASN
jgi:trimethylamine--corrinoid protein Co-methyltransferase